MSKEVTGPNASPSRDLFPNWPRGSTLPLGVIGWPVRHSLSPVIYNSAFAASGLDWAYLAFEVSPGDGALALEAARSLSLRGLSVTMPHKSDVAAAVDDLTHPAGVLNAVNCVVVSEEGRLVGHNTDGAGFLAALEHEDGFSVTGARCLVLGGGGAARAVVLALSEAGADEVVVVNRSPERGAAAAALASGSGRVGEHSEAGAMDLIVNATSVGMNTSGSSADSVPIPPKFLREGQLLVDLIYEPPRTALIEAAERQGVRTCNGVGMLVQQAAVSFELWTGIPAPREVMRAAATAALAGGSGTDGDGRPTGG